MALRPARVVGPARGARAGPCSYLHDRGTIGRRRVGRLDLAGHAALLAGEPDVVTGLQIETHMGNPDWRDLLQAIAQRLPAPRSTCTSPCGPPGLQARKVAQRCSARTQARILSRSASSRAKLPTRGAARVGETGVELSRRRPRSRPFARVHRSVLFGALRSFASRMRALWASESFLEQAFPEPPAREIVRPRESRWASRSAACAIIVEPLQLLEPPSPGARLPCADIRGTERTPPVRS